MAQWANKEEYEKWKAERVQAIKEKAEAQNKAQEPSILADTPPLNEKPKPPTEKKCPHCAMIIPKEAKICPYCRKQLATSDAAKAVLGIIIALILLGWIGSSLNKVIPSGNLNPKIASHKFRVGGTFLPALGIIVPRGTTKEQLKAMLLEIKEARQLDSFYKYIPATTPKGAYGPYAIVWLFFFEEPLWAGGDKLKQFIKSGNKNPADRAFNEEYVQYIKAEYYYGRNTSEYGTLGYDDGTVHNDEYEKLF
jgi:hypothetical protein